MPRPTIDRRVVEHLAQLSSISLSEAETEQMVRELEAIVAYVEEIGGVDTSEVTRERDVSPAPLREDVVVAGLSHSDALREAPQVAEEGFAVPTFVTAGAGPRTR
jgi:aspartyl-tRNA(Asn)/glutamyl-tRNA(Gln) amidotransferase subunit C